MCLAVPARIVALHEADQATVDLHGSRVTISTLLVPEAAAGDWVLVHAGFALERLDAAAAQATFAVLADLAAADSQSLKSTRSGGDNGEGEFA